MDAGTLLLSWQCAGGVRQTAFEIEATAGVKTLWTSGKTLSSVMRTDTPTSVPPRGKAAGTIVECIWTVQGGAAREAMPAFGQPLEPSAQQKSCRTAMCGSF